MLGLIENLSNPRWTQTFWLLCNNCSYREIGFIHFLQIPNNFWKIAQLGVGAASAAAGSAPWSDVIQEVL
jgi:hypothetical protein